MVGPEHSARPVTSIKLDETWEDLESRESQVVPCTPKALRSLPLQWGELADTIFPRNLRHTFLARAQEWK